MKLKRGYLVLTAILVAAMIQPVVYADISFTDIENHWAKDAIKEMVDKKFIVGYLDGTFKQDKEVSKLDTLIMASRVLGVDKEANKQEVATAEVTYKDGLSNYNIYGKREISFLLSRKMFTNSELDLLLKGENAKAFTKRHEVAVIFTKIMGKEKEVKNKTFVILPFMDSQEIPLDAKPYVEFLNDQGIMNGVTKTEFKPNMFLTRAQIASMLLRVSNKLEPDIIKPPVEQETTITGVISYLEQSSRSIIIKTALESKTYTLGSTMPIKVDNLTADFGSLENGFNATIKVKANEVLELNATARSYPKTVAGTISSIASAPVVKVGIKQGLEASSQIEVYEADEYLNITRNGNRASLSRLSVDDYVTAYLLPNNKVGNIVAEDKDKTIAGVVESLTTDDKVYLNVKVNDKSYKYEVMSNVTVIRNNITAGLKDIKAGDRVTVSLRYNVVREVKAESDKKTVEGTIEEIFIAKNPKITVKTGDNTIKYDMISDAVIKVDNIVSEIYDLRLGTKAEFNLDNNVIVGVVAQKKVETLEVRGLIKVINLNLGLITLTNDDDTEQTQIYVNIYNTKVNDIINSSTKNLIDLKEGQKIIAYGKNDRGVFVTSLVIITSE